MMLGYDYSFARIDMQSQFGRSMPPPWNEPHRLQLRALWNLSSQLRAVAKWQSSWGRSWGFRQSYYNYFGFRGENEYAGYDFRTPEDDRMRPFHQLDLSVVYQPEIEGLDLELRADLNNVINRRNTIDWSLRPKSPGSNQKKITKRTMPGLVPR
ncbi:MAG: hypothetical protein U5J63_14115 [Fodinibius sp.]|nr:hypothetical protein [Fodinibius sp.]